jgi:excinuclease ABC subunit C
MSDRLRDSAHRLPPRAGVYLIKDRGGRVVYIGKAKRLDQRIRSYLAPPETLPTRLQRLRRAAAEVDFIVTESEVEALVLEATLVREHRPTFNLRLKDDKTFPWVKLTVNEEVPRLSLTRRVAADGARYFGPFADVGALRRTLRILRRVFPVRTCADFESHRRADRPCLNYHIRCCVGPCIRRAGVTPEQYAALVKGLSLFLAGKHDAVRVHLRQEMERAAAAHDYERAARWRDQLRLLDRLGQPQRMAGPGTRAIDALGAARQGDDACVAVLSHRGRRVVGRQLRFLRGARGRSLAAVLGEFVPQHYLRADAPPAIVWLAEPIEDVALVEEALRSEGKKLRIRVPRRGRAHQLVALAQENAALALEARLAKRGGRRAHYEPEVHELQRALGLDRPPRRIVAFDISNLGETDAVASAVVAENGEMRRGEYKRLRMRGIGPDDFAMMHEAVGRYFSRVARGEWPAPDLVLIDGGVGQVGAARAALAPLGLAPIPLIGLAKREETVVFPEGRTVSLPRRSPALRLLQRVRDEAHRFAITYHRGLRTRRLVRSALDEIPGVGPARRRALLAAFGSVEAVRMAPVEELVRQAALPRALAERVHQLLSGEVSHDRAPAAPERGDVPAPPTAKGGDGSDR